MVQSRPPLASGFHKNDWFISSKRSWANQGFKREESLNPNDPIEATKSRWLSRNDRNYPPQTPTKASNRKNLWTQTIQSRPPKAGGFHETTETIPLKHQLRLQTGRIFFWPKRFKRGHQKRVAFTKTIEIIPSKIWANQGFKREEYSDPKWSKRGHKAGGHTTTETNSKTTFKLHQANRGTQKCPTKTGSWKKMI